MPDTPAPVAQRDGHVDTAMEVLSPSGINTYMSCNYKFYLTYGPRRIREPNTAATTRGTLVHKVAEDLKDFRLTGQRATWKMELMDFAKGAFDRRWQESPSLHKEPADFKEQTRLMVRNYINSVIVDMEAMVFQKPNFGIKGIWTMVRPKIEIKFDLVESHGLRGTIDELIEKSEDEVFLIKQWTGPESADDEVIISDLKTSKIYKIAWTDEYERQLKSYATMYFLKHGKVPNYGIIKFLAHGVQTVMKFRRSDVEEILELVKEIQTKAKADYSNEAAWKPNLEGTFCKWCYHSTATYDDSGKVSEPAPCQAGWKKWSENGTVMHGTQGTIKFISGEHKD